MAQQPKLSVVGGTEAGGRPARIIPGSSNPGYEETTIVGPDGSKFYKTPPSPTPGGGLGGDGGGAMTSLWKLDIPRDVQLAKWGVAALGALMAAMLWFLLEKIDTRFDRADDKVSEISSAVSDVRVEVAEQSGDVKAILEKLNDQSQRSDRAGQAETVRPSE